MDDQADALTARARARIGQVLAEKWRLDKLLGVGGMAVVFAATHVNNGRRAAIKLLHSELSVNMEVRTRFLREGYVANKVEHPGTVAILDDQVAADGSVFLVMELLEGETLEDRRERSGSLPAHEVLSLADRLLDVLGAAHEKGIVHRDIKPENIFLTREGQVKVLDFGIARMRELQAARLTLTSAGAIGTPAFMPPEQARGRWDDVGPRSDIWAVGATMFTLVSGRLVHSAETVNELMLAAMTKPAPPIGAVVSNLPPPVAALIDRALAYDFNARWADARAMQTALRAAYQSFDRTSIVSGPSGAFKAWTAPAAGPPSVAQPPPPPSSSVAAHPVTMMGGLSGAVPTPTRRRVPVLALVGGLVGALVMGAILFYALSRRPPPEDDPMDSPSASASAAPAPAGMATVSPAATTEPTKPSPQPTATASVTTSAAAPSTSATGDPAGSASSKPKVPVVVKPRPGSIWPHPKR
jgi:hypothetical protein